MRVFYSFIFAVLVIFSIQSCELDLEPKNSVTFERFFETEDDLYALVAEIHGELRTALSKGLSVLGIRRGYHGLLREEIIDMSRKDVADIIQRGGTILQTARSKQMLTPEGQRKAAGILKKYGVQALVVIGGDGSFAGAQTLAEYGINVVGIPGTIDLDIACTEYTIGFDTAANTAMEAIDKIRDTSTSHERCSIVEVMGHDAGYLALWCGIANGAESQKRQKALYHYQCGRCRRFYQHGKTY